MKYLRLSVTIAFTLILSQSAFPQPPSQKAKAPVKSSKEKSDAKLEAERIQKERQAQARSLLVSLASDARSFRDQSLRARSIRRTFAKAAQSASVSPDVTPAKYGTGAAARASAAARS